MNATDLTLIKNFLLTQKSQILNKTCEFKEEQSATSEKTSDEAETASLELNRNLSIRLLERDRSALFQIDRALSKLEDGTYGLCESCGESIESKRLQARPFASLCIACKEEQEDPRNLLL